MRLLLVEDDLSIQQFVERALVEAGYKVDSTADSRSAEALALEGNHDAFIIDLGLPDGDGLDLIARCRAQGNGAPVLILSARRSVRERVRGLEEGGDDYLTKTFRDRGTPGQGPEPAAPLISGTKRAQPPGSRRSAS